MSGNSNITRRGFLKVLGLGGTGAAIGGCGNTSIESGAELVQSYVAPEDFVVPGVGVYYASTCTQCASACGIMGRIREGRVLKLEGNPGSKISAGKICGLGQAAVQRHYNPDRLTTPMIKEGGALRALPWDKAMALMTEKLGPANTLKGEEIAILTGAIGGHQGVLLQNLLESLNSTNHFVYEAVSPAVGISVNRQVCGADFPRLHIDKARLIISFGSDFLGTGASPVHFARQYAQFRKAPRGTLIQIEPKMTLTGANADRWVPIVPGTEGVFALGLARELLQHEEFSRAVSNDVVNAVKPYDKETVSQITGVRSELVTHIASMLWDKTPSLVLSGTSAESQVNGSQNAAAFMLLNKILGNFGKTIDKPTPGPFPQLAPALASSKALGDLNEAMVGGKFKVLMVYGTNPVFTTPDFLQFKKNLQKVPFKVAFVEQLDETASECDLVLPILSALEDFGSHVAAYQPNGVEISLQQPLMEKLHTDTRSVGDVLLDLLKLHRGEDYKAFPDYYAYLKSAVIKAKPVFRSTLDDEAFWQETLSTGLLQVEAGASSIEARITPAMFMQPEPLAKDANFPFHFIPSERASFRDGRHANLPWLQESPDPLTTIVWDSWVEIHPSTAATLSIKQGDIIEIRSGSGSIKAKAYLFPGIHPGSVSVPLGQGHEAYGRYATQVGVNPFKILDPHFDQKTGELALYATRVSITKTAQHEALVKDEGPTTMQQGRKLVVTLAADKAQLSKEIDRVDHKPA